MNKMHLPSCSPIPVSVSYLGVTFGHEHRGRVIALSTSEVFGDPALIHAFLHVQPSSLDNGFQAHMYTGFSDTLVVCLPDLDEILIQRTFECITANSEIWKTLTGINLAKENLIIAYNRKKKSAGFAPKGIQLRQGSLLEVAVKVASDTRKALVAFVFNKHFLKKSGLVFPPENSIWKYAGTTDLLMDKNKTMQILQKYHVPVPLTYFSTNKEKNFDKTRKYVFKPSGGAAGLGVYLNEGRGIGWDDLQEHIKMLESNHLLPTDYQIQEYISGPVYGALVLFVPGRKAEILQIHSQIINQKNKFVAGNWTPENQYKKLGIIAKLVQQIAAIQEIQFAGIMGIDIIDGKVIEINPRITASSPVSHLLLKEKMIKTFLGSDFKINRIDINTGVSVPPEMISNGKLLKIIVGLWSKHRVLILPQGLNPAGNSRVLFINDNIQNHVQQKFLEGCNRKL